MDVDRFFTIQGNRDQLKRKYEVDVSVPTVYSVNTIIFNRPSHNLHKPLHLIYMSLTSCFLKYNKQTQTYPIYNDISRCFIIFLTFFEISLSDFTIKY